MRSFIAAVALALLFAGTAAAADTCKTGACQKRPAPVQKCRGGSCPKIGRAYAHGRKVRKCRFLGRILHPRRAACPGGCR